MIKQKINPWAVAVIILLILLACCVTYICVTKYKQYRANELEEMYRKGALEGYTFAVSQLMESGETCEPVDVFIENKTMQFIAVDCLNK